MIIPGKAGDKLFLNDKFFQVVIKKTDLSKSQLLYVTPDTTAEDIRAYGGYVDKDPYLGFVGRSCRLSELGSNTPIQAYCPRQHIANIGVMHITYSG